LTAPEFAGCARERCGADADAGRGDGYCSTACARINALVRIPRQRSAPAVESAPAPRRAPSVRRCGLCRESVLLVRGPGDTPALVDAEPRAGGQLVLGGDRVLAVLHGPHPGWEGYAFAPHRCPVRR
jgi:hypothetical protein